MRLLWIFPGLLALVLIWLIASSDRGSFLGMNDNQFAMFVYMAILLALVSDAIVPRRVGQWVGLARNLLIWFGIFLVLIGIYVFRFELQDIASRMSAGLIPGSPISTLGEDGRKTVTLIRTDDGHFHAHAKINGVDIELIIDTGASTTMLRAEEAARIGIAVDNLNYSIPITTANGDSAAARTKLKTLQLGNIERDDFPSLIAQPGKLDANLLGMDFIHTLWRFEIHGDRLVLTDYTR